MTFEQLQMFINSPAHVTQIALTKSAARQLLAEHEREVGKPDPGFEIGTRNTRLDFDLTLGREKRRIEADKLSGWDDVFAEVDAQRKAGLRGVL